MGKGRLPFRALSQRLRSGRWRWRWRWVAALLGSLSAPRAPEHAPRSAPGRGAGVRGALGCPGSVRTSPQVLGPDRARRCAAGAPALCAPAPAAQQLRMTSSHLPPPPPPPARTSPRAGGRRRCVRKFLGPLGDVVPSPLKGGCQTKEVTPAGAWGQSLSRVGWGPLGLGPRVLEERLLGREDSGPCTRKMGVMPGPWQERSSILYQAKDVVGFICAPDIPPAGESHPYPRTVDTSEPIWILARN